MAYKLIALTISFIAFYHTIAPGCEDCGCCVNNTCARAFIDHADRDDVCTYGSIDGYGGNRCYNKCPDDCVTCEHTRYKNCATCETGKFLFLIGNYSRCLDCPTRCKTCTSSTQCQVCNAPYYNDSDVTDCSLPCHENCLCHNIGICSSCQGGFYNISSQCQNACPDKCKTCSDTDTCQYCKEGYYSGKEYDISDRDEISDCSLSCRENCTRCNSYHQCTHCTDGKYGAYCQNTCSVGCTNGDCAIGDGSCQCKDGFTGLTCTECVTGRYGETCHNVCPSTCIDNKCNENTGQCLSCQLGYYGNRCNKAMCKMVEGEALCERTCGICTACADGFYGDFCDSAFSNQCLNNRCVKDNGHCSDGCLNGYEGPTCAVLANNLSAGMAVGISSAVTIVIVTISIFISFIILRKWFRNVHDMLRQHQELNIQASYVNTELQSIPAETVHCVGNNDQCGK